MCRVKRKRDREREWERWRQIKRKKDRSFTATYHAVF